MGILEIFHSVKNEMRGTNQIFSIHFMINFYDFIFKYVTHKASLQVSCKRLDSGTNQNFNILITRKIYV